MAMKLDIVWHNARIFKNYFALYPFSFFGSTCFSSSSQKCVGMSSCCVRITFNKNYFLGIFQELHAYTVPVLVVLFKCSTLKRKDII